MLKPKLFSMTLAICFLGSFAGLRAAQEADDLKLNVVDKTLANGLKVLIVERPELPVVSLAFMEPVGAQDAPKGKTGLPHMLEHMMFKGSENVGTRDYKKEKPLLEKMDKVAEAMNLENAQLEPDKKKLQDLAAQMKSLQEEARKYVVKDEFTNLFVRNGGEDVNAWTSQDATAYTVTLPANKVGFYAALQQDRMAHPVFREFYSEREVVAQERRWRSESTPEGALYEALQSTAYAASPYKDPSIGWMGDIFKLLRTDAMEFYQRGYRPDRGVLAIVGGVKAAEVLATLEKTVGKVANPKLAPLNQEWTVEPPQQGKKQVQVLFDADPISLMAWHMPNFPHRDAVALEVLSDILSNGSVSRLVKHLHYDKKMVTSISSSDGFPGDRNPCLFLLRFEPASGHSQAEVVKAVEEEIAAVQKDGVSEAELERARRLAKAGFLWGKTSTLGLAEDLAYNQAVHGDWHWMEKYLDVVKQLKPQDLQAVAQKYLVPENCTVADLVRPKI